MSGWAVHVVVVAYHSVDQLHRCLAALDRQVSVTVVDNSSSSEVEAVVLQHGATYVAAGSNLGFGAAVNIALNRFVGESMDVLLLNPDAVMDVRAIDTLEQFLHLPENRRMAAVSPRLRGPDGTEQRALWPFPTPARNWAEAIGLGRLPSRHEFAIGAVLLLRREAIDDVGLFDERFFLYAEEADWQRRAYNRGWASAVCTNVVADHVGGGTSTDARRRETLFHAAQETYIRKWNGRPGWYLYRVAACIGAAARTAVLTHGRRAEAARRTLLYLRGPRRCAAQRGW